MPPPQSSLSRLTEARFPSTSRRILRRWPRPIGARAAHRASGLPPGPRFRDADRLRTALGGFTPVWNALFPIEQERILRLLIERITYDPDTRDVDIELRPCGIESLAEEATQ